jgi:hypothetical protein
MARPMNMRRSKKKVTQGGPGQTTVPLTPPQVAELYGFPGPPQGFNQTIGIFEFGGGYELSDVQLFYQNVNLPAPSVTAISVDGQPNAPGGDDYTIETLLDIDVAGFGRARSKARGLFRPVDRTGLG